MTSDEEDFACAAIIVPLTFIEKDKKTIKRCVLVRDWLLDRSNKGRYGCIFNDLTSENVFFHLLLDKIVSMIKKQNTRLRDAISPGARFEATMLYLITGLPYAISFAQLLHLFEGA